MAIRFADLWRWDGTVGRLEYALVGLIGFAVKHNLDRFVTTGVFHRSWGIFNYWLPLGEAARFSKLSANDQKFLGTMLLLALPFIWVGVTMTLRRLRDAGQPPWLVAMFFLPFVNLIFFLLLSVLPETQEARANVEREGGAFAKLAAGACLWRCRSSWGMPRHGSTVITSRAVGGHALQSHGLRCWSPGRASSR